ncbi:MAG: FCD domain-containing protein [Streptosporangiales bacterium]|nr:FCD domain-containing protein [Streptosporangiales bacterium]
MTAAGPEPSDPGRTDARLSPEADRVRSELVTRLLRLDERSDSLVSVIAEWIARGIIEGRLQPGHDLNSVDLAERFGTSRTPVREALMLLEKEGLVETPPRRRPQVSTLDLRVVEEVYQLRAELLALVALRVAERARPEQLAQLREDLAAMEDAAARRDLDAYFWANVAFHERAAHVADDLTLKRTLDSLGARVLQLRHFSLSLPGRMELSLEDHRRLVRAYEEGDGPLAAALSRSIINAALQAIRESGWTKGSVDRRDDASQPPAVTESSK